MKRKLRNGYTVELVGDFDSMDELFTRLQSNETRFKDNPQDWPARLRRFNDWCGGSHGADWFGLDLPAKTVFESAVKIMRDGWADGAKRLDAAMEKISAPPAQSVRRRPVWSDNGHEVDMDRVRAGNLDFAWRKTARAEATGPKRVHIAVNTAMSSGTSSEMLFWKGAAAARLADVLTEAGYAVKISAYMVTQRGNDASKEINTMRYTVKDYMSPLDIMTVAAACCMGASHRAVAFMAKFALCTWAVPSMMGYSVQLTPETACLDEDEVLCIVPNGGATPCTTNMQDHPLDNAYAANAWVAEQIAKLDRKEEIAA